MKKMYNSKVALILIVIASLCSCSTQYPRLVSAHNKRLNEVRRVVSSSRIREKEDIKAVANSKVPAIAYANNEITVKVQEIADINNFLPLKALRQGRANRNSRSIQGKSISNSFAEMPVIKSNKVNSNTILSREDYHEHLALRGLIFIIIGLLLQGLWFTSPFGFVIAVIGIIFVIYGIICLLESL